jgi:hypothetical protein
VDWQAVGVEVSLCFPSWLFTFHGYSHRRQSDGLRAIALTDGRIMVCLASY